MATKLNFLQYTYRIRINHKTLYSQTFPGPHFGSWTNRGMRGSWSECHFVFSLVYQLCLALWSQPNTRMLVTLCICLKHYFDTRYLVFYNTSPPRMFLSLDLLWEYWIQHGANGPLYVTSCYSTWIFCRGVSGFATDCPCDVWCRGLTTCLLHVGPPFGNRILNNSWAVGLT